jgi:Cell division protein
MNASQKRKILFATVVTGLVCILIVLLAAYSAELRCENNDYIKQNDALQGEIETLNVQIKTANNIEHIEYVATTKLGMVYPTEGECVYVTPDDAPDQNFASTIREQAYN